MIRDLVEDELMGMVGNMYFPLFKKEIQVSICNSTTIDYAEKCAAYLVNMPNEVVERLCTYSIRYCNHMRPYFDEIDISIPEDINSKKILEYIEPSMLIIDEPDDDSIIAFHMALDCDWEIEHGLEWSIKDDKILYVGSYDDMNPWNKERLEYVGYYKENNYNLNYSDKE